MVTTIIVYYISTNFMHQSCLFELLGSYIKKIYVLKQVWDQENIKKLMIKFVLPSFWPREGKYWRLFETTKGSFFIIIVESGNIKVHVEDQVYVLKSGKYLLYFLIKSTFVKYEYWFRGKIILFEEVLFCSDILKNELSPYNVNLFPPQLTRPF
jgi:hypothetical protein